ncbi:MAG: 6,7-dimethyl-8-ribityllumazine synthase [Candidatus Thermoplasmatota archaeon]|nr:6,7-dimethyl-8-ribityllumazine synthase [Candidatus Thermoplasmatota archaeon]
MRIAIVAAQFNEEVTDEMTRQAEERIETLGHELAATVRVPGAYDTPLPAQQQLRRDDVDAVVVLGTVVTGETDHDQVLTHACARTLQDLALQHEKPVIFGITGPGMTYSQAKARVHYAARAVDSAVAMVHTMRGEDVPDEVNVGSH